MLQIDNACIAFGDEELFSGFACSYIKVKPLVSQANRGEEKLLF